MQSTHTKVEFNGEFRRFTLQTLSFEHLESLLRQLLPIQGASINVLFLDDENDWVLVSSDEELVYAVSIAGSPLRLLVRLSDVAPTPAKEISPEETKEDKETEEARSVSPFEERKAKKISFITARIEILEEKLTQDLPAGKATALQAKLLALRDKLARLNSEEPGNFKHEGKGCGNHRGRGRGCGSHQFANRGDNEGQTRCGRGGGRGRGRWAKHQETSENPEDQILFGRIQDLKTELKAARQANDKAQIEAKWQALQQLKAQRKALRQERNPRQPGWEAFRNLKEEKRNCLINLKEAKSTQDQEKIESCQLALKKAQEDLRNAKLEFRNAKC